MEADGEEETGDGRGVKYETAEFLLSFASAKNRFGPARSDRIALNLIRLDATILRQYAANSAGEKRIYFWSREEKLRASVLQRRFRSGASLARRMIFWVEDRGG